MKEKIKVLFVCLGNICRSPLAEAVFKKKVHERGLADFIEADSCGTSNYHIGDSPDPRTIANARKNGVTIDHCGRQLTVEDIQSFDYIMAMDRANHRNILALPGSDDYKHKVRLMREFDPLESGEVPDPYHGGEAHFQEVYEILDRTMEQFLDYLEAEYKPEEKN